LLINSLFERYYLDIDININDLLISSVRKSLDIYSQNLELSKNSFSEKNIHDFRVCIRRFLAVNSLIFQLTGNNDCVELKLMLKYQLKLFNPLRDNQVQFLKTYELVYNFPVLYKYLHFLLDREETLVSPLEEAISSFEINKIKDFVSKIIEDITEKIKSRDLGKKELINLAEARFNKVINKYKLVNPNDLRTIHKVRLAYKKFRYTMEILREIIKLTDEDLILMKSLQTTMGNIQDNAVYFRNFGDFSIMQNLEEKKAEEVKNHILQIRKLLIEEFLSNFGIIYEFQKKLIFE